MEPRHSEGEVTLLQTTHYFPQSVDKLLCKEIAIIAAGKAGMQLRLLRLP